VINKNEAYSVGYIIKGTSFINLENTYKHKSRIKYDIIVPYNKFIEEKLLCMCRKEQFIILDEYNSSLLLNKFRKF
jgi:D-alanine-D-alanine ligase-like ATP-grasp enzyme